MNVGSLFENLPAPGLMLIIALGGGMTLYGVHRMEQAEVARHADALATAEHLRAKNCRLVEIDTWRRGAFACNGLKVWYGSDVTDAWLNGAAP